MNITSKKQQAPMANDCVIMQFVLFYRNYFFPVQFLHIINETRASIGKGK